MLQPDLRRWDGRFRDREIEADFFDHAWPGIRLQAALTLIGFSAGWLFALTSDFAYLYGTHWMFWPIAGSRILTAGLGFAAAAWLLMGRPEHSSRLARYSIVLWIMANTLTAVLVSNLYPFTEETAALRTDVVVFNSYWMSVQVAALGIALAAFPWCIAVMSSVYAVSYVSQVLYWQAQLDYPMWGTSVMLLMACGFAWVMAVTFSIRARQRYFITRLYEAEKLAAEEARAFSNFLLRVAGHDIRQPVYAVNLNAGLLEDLVRERDWDPALELAQRQRSASAHIGSMLSSVLELSALEADGGSVRPEPLRVQALIDNAVAALEPLAQRRGIEIRTVPSSLSVVADRGVVTNIVSNLLANAVSHSGGTRILAGARRTADGQVSLCVLDNGQGLPGTDRVIDHAAALGGLAEGRATQSGHGLEIMFRLAELGGLALTLQSRRGFGVGACLAFAAPDPDREQMDA